VIVPLPWFRPGVPTGCVWGGGGQKQAWGVVTRSAPAVQPDLCANVLLTGGWAAMPGLAARLGRELEEEADGVNPVPFAVTCNPAACSTEAWVGAALLSQLSSFDTMWISKAEFEEFGDGLCHRKCV
jgi:actin-related protein